MDNQQKNGKQPPKFGEDAGNNETTDASTEVKSITNIRCDCLKRISDFLDIENLLNLAQTCKQLQIAAAANFGKVHRPG